MRRMVGISTGVALAMLSQSPAFAAGNCESIKNDLLYNECLAKSAPPVAGRVKGGSNVGDPEATVRGRNTGSVDERGVSISRQSKRVSAVIDPWAGARAPAGKKKR